MQKIIRINNKVIIILDNGCKYEKEGITDEEFNTICNSSDEEIALIFNPDYKKDIEEVHNTKKIIESVENSNLLVKNGDSVYFKGVSELSLPKEFIKAILKAENNNDELKLIAYKNFWTLISLNPDEECRKNLFWFLTRYDMTIAKCGFFVGYRNVDTTDVEGVYTDHYTHKFKIRIGEMVTMNRKDCDCDSSVSCSSGLHCSSVGWLKQNYYGNTGLACLINPADVVAVPHIDNYGKLRTCAYLPIKEIRYDENDDVIPLDVEDGFDCSYVTKVIYEGTMSTEKSAYKIKIPNVNCINKESIQDTLLDIAMQCVVDKVIEEESKESKNKN
jgi:hypothetical protein